MPTAADRRVLDPRVLDPWGAASARAMAAHLTAPLAAAAEGRVIALDVQGRLVVPFPTRRPLLLLALRAPLEERALTVTAALPGADAPAVLRFAPWSEAGTALPLHRPAGEAVPAFSVALEAALDGAPLPAASLAEWLEGSLSQGELGRLLALLGAEKGRLRREARQLRAMRRLDTAALEALDRMGADLGIPRLSSAPAWDAARREIVATPAAETDAAYRHRLGIHRPFLAPTRAAATALLRQGIPGLTIAEPGTPLAIAIRLLAIGPPAARTDLLARLRADWLVQPRNDPPANAAHAARFLPAARRVATAELRNRLRARFDFAAGAALAPGLAAALDRAERILAAIGHPDRIAIAGAGDPAGGSRFETGLGLSIAPLALVEADALRDRLLAPRDPGEDAEAEALIAAARAAPPEAGDVTLSWLWRAAGFRTAHRLATDALYLSDMPVRGLVIAGPDAVTPGAPTEFRAIFEAEGDPAMNAALGAALARATAGQAAAGAPAFAVLSGAEAAARRAAAADIPAASPLAAALAAGGLAAPVAVRAAAAAVGTLPGELHRTLSVDPGLSAGLRAGDPASAAPLAALVRLLRESGVTALLPLATATEVVLVAAVTPLPAVGVNLGERRATGIRWAVVSLGGSATLTGLGSRTLLTGGTPGPVALVALGHLREGAPDPYEIRPELPEGRLLSLAEYEWLMNALERCFALGVEVNTWRIRQSGVDLDGDGTADPLPPGLARHYRRFRMPRLRGLDEPEA
ncbi:hypothetical protein [Roseomonas sp. BN140053]|uniref:hypothetical protein n=1 Tax=Roseomonas sp. BN140053 TaxID=3391898 RepID=UPI0039E7E39F